MKVNMPLNKETKLNYTICIYFRDYPGCIFKKKPSLESQYYLIYYKHIWKKVPKYQMSLTFFKCKLISIIIYLRGEEIDLSFSKASSQNEM